MLIPFLQNTYRELQPWSTIHARGKRRKTSRLHLSSARPDGLTIGLAGSGFVSNAILGQSGVLYDVDKFVYLGAADTGAQYVFLTRKDAGLNSLEKLRAFSGLRIGSQSVGHSSYIAGRIFTYLIGLRSRNFSPVTRFGNKLALKSGR